MCDALAEQAIHVARNDKSRTASTRRLDVDTIKWLRRYGEKVVPDATAKVSIGNAIEMGRERVRRMPEG